MPQNFLRPLAEPSPPSQVLVMGLLSRKPKRPPPPSSVRKQPHRNGKVLAALLLVGFALAALLYLASTNWLFPPPLAVLSTSKGMVERDFAARTHEWNAATLGAQLVVGDGVRTGQDSEAVLTLLDHTTLKLLDNAQVRFRRAPGSAPAMELQTGLAILETSSVPLEYQTEFGTATIQPNSRVRVVKLPQSIRYELLVGLAQFRTLDGDLKELKAGEGIELKIGEAIVQAFALDDTTPTVADTELTNEPMPEPEVPESTEVRIQVSGRSAKARAPGTKNWKSLPKRQELVLEPGTELRTSPRTEVQVTRGRQALLIKGVGRYRIGAPGEELLHVERGLVTLSGTQATIQVPAGRLATQSPTHGEISVKPKSTQLRISGGKMLVRTESGTEGLVAGEQAIVSRSGKVTVQGRGPNYFDFVVTSGESFAVHDPRPPVAVRFIFQDKCPKGGLVELTDLKRRTVKNFSRGDHGANLLVPRGHHRYQVRCRRGDVLEPKPSIRGSLSVARDSGRAKLPKTPPNTDIEADGRRYTVLYQNRLPSISVKSLIRPKTSFYRLKVESPKGKTRVLKSSSPRFSFKSGDLNEGKHRLTFQTDSTDPEWTTLQIRFDNAAPAASLHSPRNRRFSPGENIRVSGIAIAGARVSVLGSKLRLDSQHRFSLKLNSPVDRRAVAVRIAHPRQGVHYYLRYASKDAS